MKLLKIVEKEILKLESVLCIAEFGNDSNDVIESDIDLLIIYKSDYNIAKLKEQLLSIFNKEYDEVNIVWGDDEQYFYFFRNINTIDIELVKEKSQFYIIHKLLGLSINATLKPICPHNQDISKLLLFPENKLELDKRTQILINSRKGLSDFNNYLINDNSTKIDLRRIAKHIIRNILWCIYGIWESDFSNRIKNIQNNSLFPKELLLELYSISNLNKKTIRSDYFILKKRISQILCEIIEKNTQELTTAISNAGESDKI